jgi:hypothetical protein
MRGVKLLARWLRTLADRIDYEGAPKIMGWSFTFEDREGIRFRRDGKGCRLAYLGDAEYEKAHGEADKPAVRVDWAALDTGMRKRPRKPKWSHPCPVCNARGYAAPHPGQHTPSSAPPVPPVGFSLPAPPAPSWAREKGGYSPRPEVYDLDNLPNAPDGPAQKRGAEA